MKPARGPFQGRGAIEGQRNLPMELPIFPLNVVLFPGMMLPLHIFEPRYHEMVNRCVEEHMPFGVVLIQEGHEVGSPAKPYKVGTAARILRVEHTEGATLNITTVGTQRFKILELDRSHSYLSAKVDPLPTLNGSTRAAQDMVYQVRPKVIEYVELLSKASQMHLKLDRLPEDPTTLAYLVAIALQVNNAEKQKLLQMPGIPELLDRERYLLSRELLLLQHMVSTQREVEAMSFGVSGTIFPN